MPIGITGAELVFTENQTRFSGASMDDENIRLEMQGTAQLKEDGDHSFYIRPSCAIVLPSAWLKLLLARLGRLQYETQGYKGAPLQEEVPE